MPLQSVRAVVATTMVLAPTVAVVVSIVLRAKRSLRLTQQLPHLPPQLLLSNWRID